MRAAPTRISRQFLPLMATLAVTSFLAQVTAQSAWGDYPELVVTVTEQSVTVPTSVEAGFYRLVIDDRTEVEPDLFFIRIGEGSTAGEVHAALHAISAAGEDHSATGPALARLATLADLVGGRSMPEEGVIIELRQGEHLLMTSLDGADGVPIEASLTVTASATPSQPPTADVRIEMDDFSFAVPALLAAGKQTWELVNAGDQVHHLILMRLNEGITFEDVMSFLGSEGPPSDPPPFEMVVASELLTTSVSNYFRFDVAPGNYLAICFLPDAETGAPHFALGMMQEFSVPGN